MSNFVTPGGSGSAETVYAGVGYVLTEANGPSGYIAGDWDCDNGDSGAFGFED